MKIKKAILSVFLSFVVAINFCLITAVNAADYEENTFTDGKCITGTDWQSYAKTAYTLTSEGEYETSGEDYSESSTATIFYVASEDGKVLYAFVPNYDKKKESAKDELSSKIIVTTDNCADTYVMNKTVVGNPPDDDSYMDFDSSDNNAEDGDSAGESEQNGEVDEDSDTNGADESDINDDGGSNSERISTANTASPLAITGIIISVVLVAIAAYAFIKKYRPDLLEKVIKK